MKCTELCRNILLPSLVQKREREREKEHIFPTQKIRTILAAPNFKRRYPQCNSSLFFACLVHFLTLTVSFFCNVLLVCFCLSVCLSVSLSLSLSVASFIAISALHTFLFNFLFLIHPPILPTSVGFEVLMMVRYLSGWRQEILLKR